MAATKTSGWKGFDLDAHDAPEIRPKWRSRPVEYYAARLRAGQRLIPLAGPLPVREGLEARVVFRVEGFDYRPEGRSFTEIAGLELVRFDVIPAMTDEDGILRVGVA